MIFLIFHLLPNFAKSNLMKKYIHYKGKKIFYTDEGKGAAVVLLHGYLESSEVWHSFAEKLVPGYRVINIDLPGHGDSDIYGESHSMELIAEAVNGLLNGVGIAKSFLVGHSLGGYVALAFLEQFPEKLSGYSLFHSHPFADSYEALQKREREIKIVNAGKKFLMYPENIQRMFAEDNLKKFSAEIGRSKEIASRIPASGITAVLKGMMARPSRLALMEEGKVPCLWILGRKDNYLNCDAVQQKVKLPSNAKLAILENSGHLGFIEEEERSLKLISDFISSGSR